MPGYDYLFNNTGPTGQNEIMPPNYNGPSAVDPMTNLMAQHAGIFEGPNSYDNNSAPMINQGNPYRLSSNRQPGVDIGNDMYSPPQEGGIMRNFKNYLDENRSDKLRDYMNRGLLPRGNGIETLEANVDPSDWRVIQQIMGAGGNPDDYIETAGLGSDIYNYLDDMLDFEGMKDQIPYMLDNFTPNWLYEPPEGYYDETDEWKEEIV
tara:strand:- start:2442 stop:3062 length:621 start_codon:yes stop_codon:yes gene_type:complete